MANFTDIFIKRPVLATVVSLLIFFFGLRAIDELNLRQFPKMENTVITVSTAYPGASAKLIQGFITSPLQKSIASADGIDYLTATSTQGVSSIKAYIKLNFDPDKAFTNIMAKVAEVRGELPRASEQPIVNKETGSQVALMYISFSSNKMTPEQITDYISRVVQPKVETVSGVAKAEVLGAKTFAMRVWLNPHRMAALNITAVDVSNALRRNNFQSAAGQIKGEYVTFNVDARTGLASAKTFKNMVVKGSGDSLIRLRDIARVELGSIDYDSSVIFNGQQSIFMGVTAAPTANPLTVITNVRKILPHLIKTFPPSLKGKIVYDATKYISSSIHEVMKTIIEATLIVILVIYLFLGSLRTVIIPVVTIPLSLVGVCSLMLVLGYSINLLTLLAMVLAIGLVVDDAIVVVENIHRHIEEGLTPFAAAIKGAREIAMPVVAMTITLAAVYAPIGFMGGLTGALFKEFAFTLASAVIISGIVALTLSPMMCSHILIEEKNVGRFALYLDQKFHQLKVYYEKKLHLALNYRPVIFMLAAVVLASCYFLYTYTQHQLAPNEDKNVLFVSSTAPQYANIDYVTRFTHQFDKIYRSFPEMRDYFIVNGMGSVNNVISGFILKPWGERKRSQDQIQPILQQKLSQVAGMSTVAFPLPPLPTSSGGLPVQFVITSTMGYPLIYQYAEKMKDIANKSGLFIFVDSSLKYNKPEVDLLVDRNKAATLGIQMADIGESLSTLLGGAYINRFDLEGRSYEVIPQVERQFRLNPGELNNFYIRSVTNTLIPLSTIVSIEQSVQPNKLTQFQQLNSATLSGIPRPGYTMGDVLHYLAAQADKIFPVGLTYDYSGESRQFMQEGTALVYTFFFALLVIFLVLAAQFESFRDPLIILVSVPMSISGALIPLYLGLSTINVYSQVGLITLIGLISKHGILMVEFANHMQESGKSVREAIEHAAATRLRPILMTTAAMIMGVVPLILASGAGANSRYSIGLVIAMGMAIGTLFTLFVVPAIYTLLAARHQQPEPVVSTDAKA